MSLLLRTAPLVKPILRSWWRLRRPMTLGARVIALDPDGCVALVRHTYTHGLHLPGGGVERGERLEESALRELREETGASPCAALRLIGVYANFRSFPGDHVALFQTQVDAARARPPDREIAEVIWTRPEAPPDDATPATRRRLSEVFAGAPVSLDW